MVEGAKSVSELLDSDFDVVWLAASESFLYKNEKRVLKKNIEVVAATEKELEQLGTFQTNDAAIAIAKMRPNEPPNLKNEFCLVLDDLRDPGNVGTIIRAADWYGIKTIFASEETADFYNPKTISATMGSFCRVKIFYINLEDFFSKNSLHVYGTFMNGEDIHQIDFGKSGAIVIGNESSGISTQVTKFVNYRITIPKIGGAESLNAAMATGIVLDNVFRSKK